MDGDARNAEVTDSTQYFPTKIPLRRYFSGLAAVGYSLLLFSLLLDHDLYDADNNLLEGDCRVVVCPVA